MAQELKTKWGSNRGADVKFKKRQPVKEEPQANGKKGKKNSGKKEG